MFFTYLERVNDYAIDSQNRPFNVSAFLKCLLVALVMIMGVGESIAQTKPVIKIVPAEKSWTYDGTEHGDEAYACEVFVNGVSKGTYTSPKDDETGEYNPISVNLNTTTPSKCTHNRAQGGPHETCWLWVLCYDHYEFSGTVLTININTRITDVGQKIIVPTVSIETGSFYELRYKTDIFAPKGTPFRTRPYGTVTNVKSNYIVNVEEKYYKVTPRPLTINCIGSKTYDMNTLTSAVRGNSTGDEKGFTITSPDVDLTYQYDGLVKGEYVSAGAFTTELGNMGTYTYPDGSPASVISTDFKILKSNGSNSTSNYDITFKASQKISSDEGLVSRLISVSHLSCPEANDGVLHMEIKRYDSNYKYYYQIGTNPEVPISGTPYVDEFDISYVPFDITGLAAGNYELKVRKKNNKGTVVTNGEDLYPITISDPEPVEIACSAYTFLSKSNPASVEFPLPKVLNGTVDSWQVDNGLEVNDVSKTITGSLPVGRTTVTIKAISCDAPVKECTVTVSVVKSVEPCETGE